MSDSKHTPEPWKVKTAGNWDCSLITNLFGADHRPIAGHDRDQTTGRANLARAAACVNACAGIADPETTVPQLLTACEACLSTLREVAIPLFPGTRR